jgi:hypothetical protein
MNWKKILEASSHGLMKLLFRQMPGGTDEIHDKPEAG